MTKNTRIEGKTVKVKRQDIRIPLDFYDRLKQIAVERFNAHVHHRSGEPTITPTLLKLAELGIEYLESGLADKKTEITTTEVVKRLENLESNKSDNNTDKLLKELTSRVETIENQLTDSNTDTRANIIDERLSALEQRIKENDSDRSKELEDRIKALEQQLTDNNTDTIPNKSADKSEKIKQDSIDNNTDNLSDKLSEKEEAEEQQEIDNSAHVTSEAKDFPPSFQFSANADNNSDTNTDKKPDFYSGVKELLSSSNDPDLTHTEENVSDKPKKLLPGDELLLETAPSTAKVEETGLTDDELALKLGVNASSVNRWRVGRSKPRGLNLKRLKEWEVRGDRWFRKDGEIE